MEVEAGRAVAREVALDGDVLRIGSHPSNDLVIDDPQVSRFHCQLRADALGWRLVDSSSLNGSRIGGLRVRDADVRLPNCRIEIGDSTIVVRTAPPVQGRRGLAPQSFGGLYGAAPVMRRMYERIQRIAKTEGDVLIEGESGTGKELIAAEIVERSDRAGKPLIIVDCGAIAPTLFESELFGHDRGAFTGADKVRVGAFEAAQGGTVFLDEIGELPLDMQPRLLRALAARSVRRLGENEARPIDVRVIAATNRRLEDEINKGAFREDLYFRLSVLRIDVPPLRERLEDLPLLVGRFLQRAARPDKLADFTSATFEEMRAHHWPGNVRELRNFVERFVVFDEREPATRPSVIPHGEGDDLVIATPFRQLKETTIQSFERTYLRALMSWSGGNVSKAARKANIDRMHLHRLLQKYGLGRSEPFVD